MKESPMLVQFEMIQKIAFHAVVTALTLFRDIEGYSDWKDRTGGYFTFAEGNGHPILTFRIGPVPKEKVEKYHGLSLEKAKRLGENFGHASSFKSRDGETKWGGAVRGYRDEDNIFSFSGLPELGDMVVTYFVAEKLELRNTDDIDALVRSENFLEMYTEFKEFSDEVSAFSFP